VTTITVWYDEGSGALGSGRVDDAQRDETIGNMEDGVLYEDGETARLSRRIWYLVTHNEERQRRWN